MTAFILIVALVPAGSLVKTPTAAELVAAARSGDDVEIERVATRVGAVRLLRQAARGSTEERLAALRALPLVDDAWAVLPDLARLVGDKNEEIATSAADCARRIALTMSPANGSHDELPPDVSARAAKELSSWANNASARAPLRVVMLEALASLRGAVRVEDRAFVTLLSDREAPVRRAAAECLADPSDPDSSDRALEDTLTRDSAVEVAAAAGASLCRAVPLIPANKESRVEARLSKLGPAARARLRSLALDETVPLADRLDLVTCLRVGKKDADQKTLDQLARRPPESLRRRARALGGR